MIEDAFEIVGDRAHMGRLVLTCEHAANRVPPPITVSDADRRILQTHWGWDIGAAEVVRELVHIKDCLAVLARFSRLVVDPNRPPDHHDLIRADCGEDGCVAFNEEVSDAERARRLAAFYEPYHDAVDRYLGERVARGGEVYLCSVHSFTPILGVDERWMELGVLFDEHEDIAEALAEDLRGEGFKVALNEPYSGRTGLIFAAARHGSTHGVVHVEIEIRQDLIDTPEKARAVAHRLRPSLARLELK
jgi:predicted N-formylglutamate amidohydrolase